MITSAGNSYYVEVGQVRGTGDVWIVRLFKRVLFFKKMVSSDWFLNEEQARKFGERLAIELKDGGSLETIRTRKPGWTLHPPSR